MNCVIIDDEQLARTLLESYIEKIPFLNLKGAYKSGLTAMEDGKLDEIDLIITDIQMPDLLGTDLVKTLHPMPLVIFTTAYQDYAVEGFELEAVDYLLKPFPFERFLKAIHKAKELYDLRGKKEHSSTFKSEYLTVKADHKLYRIAYTDIKYIEGMREYVSFHITEGRITALMSLKSLEEKLPKALFIRSHKSFIVNKNKVSALESGSLVIEKKHIPVGQSYKERVMAEIF